MALMQGKKGIVFGVANDRSLGWQIADQLHQEGAELGFNYLPNEKMERRVRKLTEPIGPKLIAGCDVTSDEQIRDFFDRTKQVFGQIDFLVHAIAYASRDALSRPYYQTSRADFAQAMDVSCYSLVALCQAAMAADVFAPNAAVVTLTYFGSVAVIPGYNVMGVCKAALESSMRYLAAELGRAKNVRVNALSAGPVKTLSASGVADFDKMLDHYPTKAPLARNVEYFEVGKAGLYLLSPLSSGVTGTIHFVDGGYNIVGW